LKVKQCPTWNLGSVICQDKIEILPPGLEKELENRSGGELSLFDPQAVMEIDEDTLTLALTAKAGNLLRPKGPGNNNR
jgi:hypothetical protein